MNAKNIFYLKIMILFLINGISNKERRKNKKNETPLHRAAAGNSKEIGEILISKGADVNAKTIIYLHLKILFLISLI